MISQLFQINMIAFLLNKFKSIVLGILDLLNKIICCKKKQRHHSGIPLHKNNSTLNSSDDVGGTNWDDDGWDSCEVVVDKSNVPAAPQTTSDHIAAYRQHVSVARQKSLSEEKEEEPDLFSDMAPQIKKQQKIYVGKDSPNQRKNRLVAQNIDPIITMGAELGNWGDENTGWEAEDEDIIDVMKEHKRHKM